MDERTKAYLAQGELAIKGRDLAAALRWFDMAVSRSPTEGYAAYQLGTMAGENGFNGIAQMCLMRAIDEAKPEDKPWLSQAWTNLGVAFRREGNEENAIDCYKRSLEIKPECALTYANWSGCYVNQGKPDEGLKVVEEALRLDHFNEVAGHHKGLMLLEKGDYENGWRWYQHRMRLPEFHFRKYQCPMWDGSPVDTLIIHGEQGIGDEIMFASLIPEAMKRAKKIVIECTARLIPIFERSFGVKCYPDEKSIVEAGVKADAFCGMGSLPYIFGLKEQLQHDGYLKANEERVEHWKKQYPGFRIGVSWRGGTKKTHEQFRNFAVEDWKSLMVEGAYWLSVQYSEPEDERKYLGLEKVEVEDFDDHLALVKACDLVISVCNTTIHEAGAVNTPCWILVPNKPAWRYGLHGDRMLFYPSNRMYRQGANEIWSSVIERIATDLRKLPEIERRAA